MDDYDIIHHEAFRPCPFRCFCQVNNTCQLLTPEVANAAGTPASRLAGIFRLSMPAARRLFADGFVRLFFFLLFGSVVTSCHAFRYFLFQYRHQEFFFSPTAKTPLGYSMPLAHAVRLSPAHARRCSQKCFPNVSPNKVFHITYQERGRREYR